MPGISAAADLGTVLGTSLSDANGYKDTFIGTEDINSLNFVGLETVRLTGSWFVNAFLFSSHGWILDIPGLDTLDTSTNVLDAPKYSGSQLVSSGFI